MAKRATKTKVEVGSLGPALDFLAPLLLPIGDPNQTQVILHGQQAVVWNGVVAAGHPIDEGLSAVVHGLDLRTAVGRAGAGLVLALEPPLLTVSAGAGGRLRVRLPMLPLDSLQHAVPDPNVMALDAGFLAGLEAIAPLAAEGHARALCACVGVNGGTMMATDGKMMLEYWHGFNLPFMNLPKKTIAFLLKIKKGLIGFGFGHNGNTATFHFEDGIWVRTQLYQEGWNNVDINNLFQGWDHTGGPIPEGFWEAFDDVKNFIDTGADPVHFIDGGLSSTKDGQTGAFSRIASAMAPQGLVAPVGHIALMRDAAPTIVHWLAGSDRDRIAFRNDKLRGLIMHIRYK